MSPTECRRCGMCCQAYSVIPIHPDDAIPDHLMEHDAETGQLGMIRRDGACIAFDRQTRLCTIYNIRPLACREVQRDDCMCRTARSSIRT